jgi:group I intron endonuclease
MSKRIIYILHRDDSNSVYVGKTNRGLFRAREHKKPYNLKKFAHLPVVRWINKHGDYVVTVLEECLTDSDLVEAEKFYIAYFRCIGMQLLNLTVGGEGIAGLKKSKESIEKTASKIRGRKASAEAKKAMVDAWTPERRKAKSEERKNTKLTQETLANLLAAAKRPKGETHRSRIGDANRRRIWTPESIAKRTASRKRNVLPRIRINLLGVTI